QALMRKVERVLDPDIEAQGWEKIRSTVEVDLADGRTLVEKADERYRGGPDLPFTRDELFEKFSDCASLVLSPESLELVFEMAETLEQVSDIGELVHHMSAAGSDRAAAAR
ncbi:MAG: MmgE/PrpD family protein, partial [Gammaproteobacteria bacterium]|nr:MmgE/PrpD family protein [Gammaproteobacteria bacterium]